MSLYSVLVLKQIFVDAEETGAENVSAVIDLLSFDFKDFLNDRTQHFAADCEVTSHV